MHKKDKNNIEIDITYLKEFSENISLGDNSVDTILLTYALCTIPDPSIKRWQDWLNPINSYFSGGCNLNRDITGLIVQGGFKIKNLDTMYLPGTTKVLGYNYWGTAVI